jgi:DNA-binding transcriptional LysR family regulator
MELWELEKEPFIHTQPGQDTEIDRLLAESGIKPDVRFTTLNAFTTYNMVAAGLGISVDQSLRSRDWTGSVVKLPLRPRQYEAFGIAVPSGAGMSPATKSFMEYVRRAGRDAQPAAAAQRSLRM